MKAPHAEDSEILLSKRVLNGSGSSEWVENYVKAKIYTKLGVERSSIFHIEHVKRNKVWDIGARVVKPDGTIVELDKAAFVESSALKTSGYELRKVSFTFPKLEAGDIVEYQWKEGENEKNISVAWRTYFCQEAAPTRDFEFDVVDSKYDFNVMWFNCPAADVKKVGSSQMVLHIRNIPAFVEEPNMPAQHDFRGWIAIVFTEKFFRWYSNNDVWEELGDYKAEAFRLDTRVNNAIKEKAIELTKGATTDDEKLTRLCAFCQRELINFDAVESEETLDARTKREKKDDTQSAADTFNKKSGNSDDINRVFAALAKSLGYDVRIGMSASRDEFGNIRFPKGWLFLRRESVVVKVGDQWRVFSPGNYFSPAGMLSPLDEDVTVFVCDEKKSWYLSTPASPPDKNMIFRSGHFTLDADGSLQGTVEETLHGNAATLIKEKWAGVTEAEVMKSLQEQITNRVPGGEISDFHATNIFNADSPVTINYKIHVEGYAESAGSRLILTPNFFEVGTGPRFTAEERKYPVMFDYCGTTRDKIEIVLPAGYKLDSPSAPANIGKPQDVINAIYGVSFHPKTSTLVYQRNEVVGRGGAIAFRPESYQALKKIFEDIDHSNHHNFVLKPAEATSSPAPAATSAK